MSLRCLRIVMLLIPFIAACGGGGGGEPSAPPPAAALVTIAGFSPAAAGAGALLTVTGKGFGDVSSVSVGGVAASYTVISDTQLTMVVPAGASDGAIQLNHRAGAVQTNSSLKIVGEAAVATITPTLVQRGQNVTLSGTALDTLRGVQVGGLAASILSQSATELVFTVPMLAIGGRIELVAANEKAVPLAQSVSFDAQIVLDGFEPVEASIGAQVTLRGSGLLDVSEVRFGTASAVVAPGRSDTVMVVTLPVGAVSGPLALLGGSVPVTSASAIQVVPTVAVSSAAPLGGVKDTVVTLTGTGLDAVSGVTIAGDAMRIISQSAKTIEFLAGQSGEVVVNGRGGQRSSLGVFNVTAGAVPVVSVARIDIGQNFSQPVGSPRQELVPAKSALLRAYVLNASSLPSPAVTASVYDGSGALMGSIALQGPSRLPAAVNETSLENSFNASLPAAWVQAGMAVTVNVSSEQPFNTGASNSVRPVVGSIAELKVMLVPLIAYGQDGQLVQGVVPSIDAVKSRLARTYPVAPERIQIAVRTPYLMSEKNRSFSDYAFWERGLSELESLRVLEKSDWNYYGLVPRSSVKKGAPAGLGYMPQQNDGAQQSAIGYDDSPGFDRYDDIMVHEIGHNKSRGHAPCGAVSFLDESWPKDDAHSGARLGPSPLIDPATASLVVSTRHGVDDTDIMGYCGGLWFSDHNYAAIQRFLAQRPVAAAQARSVPYAQILIRGRIEGGEVVLSPLIATSGTRHYTGSGEWTLRLSTADGQVLSQRFSVATLPDSATDAAFFALTLPRIGDIAKIEVLREGKSLPLRVEMPPPVAARAVGEAAVAEGPRVDWVERNGQLELSWNADRYPALQVVHRGATNIVLAAHLTGGQATLSLAGLPAGGSFAFSLSTGLDARSVVVSRDAATR